MNIWYAVFVKGQTTDLPAAVFFYGDSAAAFAKNYGDRAEVKPVLLSGALQIVTIDSNAISLS